MGESVDEGCTNAKAGKRAGTRHKSDFGEVVVRFAVFGEFIAEEL